jgi:hypothetical protein
METVDIIVIFILAIIIVLIITINMNYSEKYDIIEPPDKILSTQYWQNNDDYIKTSNDKTTDDANRLLYPNSDDVNYGKYICQVNKEINQELHQELNKYESFENINHKGFPDLSMLAQNVANLSFKEPSKKEPNDLNTATLINNTNINNTNTNTNIPEKYELEKPDEPDRAINGAIAIRHQMTKHYKLPTDYINNGGCPNKSLNELHMTGKNMYKIDNTCGQLASNAQLDKSGEPSSHFNGSDNEVDPAEFYKVRYRAIPLQLEDDRFKGWNYDTFGSNGHPSDVGFIPLSKTNDFPVGVNYKFYE